MGRIAKHTDLSWEVPGLRADVDVPLEYPAFPGSDLVPWAGAEWHDDPDREPQHESAAGQRLKPLSTVLARIPRLRGRRRTRRER
jgi:hypothetical protein